VRWSSGPASSSSAFANFVSFSGRVDATIR
jgi:hypothetical protein